MAQFKVMCLLIRMAVVLFCLEVIFILSGGRLLQLQINDTQMYNKHSLSVDPKWFVDADYGRYTKSYSKKLRNVKKARYYK